MTALRFDKLEGTGNDFIVVNAGDAGDLDWPVLAPGLCDRHHGVGADGVLIVGRSQHADLRMRLINADGSEAEMCGNGIRCTARYALDHGITNRHVVVWETGAGKVRTEVMATSGEESMVRVNMGTPRLRPADIPMDVAGESAVDIPVHLDGLDLKVSGIGMGNPHAVAFVDAVDAFPLTAVGPQVENHPLFPRRTNFEVVEVVDSGHIRMRVWERGVGETMACGTGACAAAVAAHRQRGVGSDVEVSLPGGKLALHWEEGSTVLLTGTARTVYRGSVDVRTAALAGVLSHPA